METKGSVPPESAAHLLQRHEEIRSRVEQLGPSRGYAWLLLSSGLLLSVYVGVYLFVLADLTAVPSGPGGYTNLMLLPVLIFSALAKGARDRFSIRTTSSSGQLVAYGVAFAGFVALGSLALAGIDFPWWLRALVPVVLCAAMTASPIRTLWATRSAAIHEPWLNLPMSAPARCTTASIGIVLGVLAASSTSPWFPTVSAAVLMVTMLTALVGWRAPWGLPRTGYQWGPFHWIAFAASTAVTFTLVVLLVTPAIITTPIAIIIGGLVSAVMLTGALIPRRPSQR